MLTHGMLKQCAPLHQVLGLSHTQDNRIPPPPQVFIAKFSSGGYSDGPGTYREPRIVKIVQDSRCLLTFLSAPSQSPLSELLGGALTGVPLISGHPY